MTYEMTWICRKRLDWDIFESVSNVFASADEDVLSSLGLHYFFVNGGRYSMYKQSMCAPKLINLI